MRIGLVSDTHGRFDTYLNTLFRACDVILHAGDIGEREVLSQLGAIAPATAVRGNNDWGELASKLKETEQLLLKEIPVLLIHDLGNPASPKTALQKTIEQFGVKIVVYGHTHQPAIHCQNGVILVNPGSAGRARYSPRSAGLLRIEKRLVRVELFNLEKNGLLLGKAFVAEI